MKIGCSALANSLVRKPNLMGQAGFGGLCRRKRCWHSQESASESPSGLKDQNMRALPVGWTFALPPTPFMAQHVHLPLLAGRCAKPA